jgi:hypothetical protein
MVTVVYPAYGRKRFTQAFGGSLPLLERGDDLATAFSALTFFHVASTLRDAWRLVVYTDAPRVFRRFSIPCDQVRTRQLMGSARSRVKRVLAKRPARPHPTL